MPKPTTGRVQPVPPPQPDTEQMATDALMTSVFTGISLVVATLVYAILGGVGAFVADSFSEGTWRVGLGVGLAVAVALIVVVLRTYSGRIKARSVNLYRGAWIGSIAALVILVLLAYIPQVAFPNYCPPGAVCTTGQP